MQVSVFPDVQALEHVKDRTATDCDIRGCMLVPLFACPDPQPRVPVALLELVQRSSDVAFFPGLIKWLRDKLPVCFQSHLEEVLKHDSLVKRFLKTYLRSVRIKMLRCTVVFPCRFSTCMFWVPSLPGLTICSQQLHCGRRQDVHSRRKGHCNQAQ